MAFDGLQRTATLSKEIGILILAAKFANGPLCDNQYSLTFICFLRLIIYVSWRSVVYEPRVKLLNFIVCDLSLSSVPIIANLLHSPTSMLNLLLPTLLPFLDLRSKLQIFTDLNFMFSLS